MFNFLQQLFFLCFYLFTQIFWLEIFITSPAQYPILDQYNKWRTFNFFLERRSPREYSISTIKMFEEQNSNYLVCFLQLTHNPTVVFITIYFFVSFLCLVKAFIYDITQLYDVYAGGLVSYKCFLNLIICKFTCF